MPLGPERVALRRGGEELRVEVGYALEKRRPVLLDLLSTSETSDWMSGLLAPVVGLEAGEKCLQIVLVHCSVEALHSFQRGRPRVCTHSWSLLSSPWPGEPGALFPGMVAHSRAH